MSDKFSMGVDLAHDLELALRRTGWEDAEEVKKLASGDVLRMVREVVLGRAEIRPLVPIAKAVEQVIGTAAAAKKLAADYGQTLAQMIAGARFDLVNGNITEKNFPHQGTGVVELEPELVHLGRTISSEEALAKLNARGRRAGTMAELVRYGAENPDEQREYPIVALGQVGRFWSDRLVGVLGVYGSERRLGLSAFEYDWRVNCRFLAFRK